MWCWNILVSGGLGIAIDQWCVRSVNIISKTLFSQIEELGVLKHYSFECCDPPHDDLADRVQIIAI